MKIERQFGSFAFAEQRPNRWAARLGYLSALGHSTIAIAEELGDNTAPGTVSVMQRRYGLELPPGPRLIASVTPRQRNIAHWLAQREGIEPEEWVRRLVISAIERQFVGG